ncbi:MAG: proton-conducting transporter membrane subunit [Chloroflexota bacterium]
MPSDPAAGALIPGILIPLAGLLAALAATAALLPGSGRLADRLPLWLTAASAAAILGLGVAVLVTGRPVTAAYGDILGFPLVSLRVDGLSALFLLILGFVGAAAAVFGVGYGAHGPHGAHGTAPRDRTVAALPVFIVSLGLVFGSSDAISFLFAWEAMAVSSAILVFGSRPSPSEARAGYIYLALTHLAAVAVLVAFAVLASAAGSTDTGTFAAAAAALPAPARDLVFVLFVIGFGTKAGAIPFHVWLPRAHPVAPSHVSALMSGVMVKAGIYGLVRFGLEILGPGPSWWGLLVLGIGVVSAVLGVLYALMENDLKRLLAFSTIENVGIILVGIGVAILAAGQGVALLGTIALTAALVHTLNHALFKSGLFLAAGAVQGATGTRDLNRLGGLARVMPATTLVFMTGAAAISGLPPLNGFTGEWLTFQALIGAGGEAAFTPLVRSAAVVALGGLGLTAALAVATFVKAAGVGFLALPRSDGAAAAREVGRSMVLPMAALAFACVAAGLLAGPMAGHVADIAAGVLAGRGATPGDAAPGAVGGLPGSGGYAAAPVMVLLAVVFAVAWLAGIRGRPVRRVPTWTCGILPEQRFEYTSASFAKLIRLYFDSILRPARELTVELHPGTPFPRTVRYRSGARQLLDERVYRPLHRSAVGASQLARQLQNGSLQLYLAYAVVAVVVLLVLAR